MRFPYFLVLLLLIISCTPQEVEIPDDAIRINVDYDQRIAPVSYAWAMFGHDEPNYTYMEDGKKLLNQLSDLSPVQVYVRTHNLLTTGDGEARLKWGSTNAYTEDEGGNPVYDWTVIDSIFDTYVEKGVRPLVEIGFMPQALSTQPEPYAHQWEPGDPYDDIYTGWAYPPDDYEKWAELIYQWVRHSIDRYGQEEVEKWYWELWNEPNIGYWQGTMEEYFKLYDYTAAAVKRALPSALMGGPHTTGPGWDYAEEYLRAFLDHCLSGTNHVTGGTGTPLDFIAYHAKGAPQLTDEGRIRMNMGQQLHDIATGFRVMADYPALKDTPIILGESDPEGCAACPSSVYPQFNYRNNTIYSSYTAASIPRTIELARKYEVNLRGIVSWAFEFEDQPWYSGFRDLATNGIEKPVLNVFRMLGKMTGDQVKVSGDLAYTATIIENAGVRGARDINGYAAIDNRDNKATLMIWNYHDDDTITAPQHVAVLLKGLPEGKAKMKQYLIDQEHSNSYTTWKAMGSPQQPTPEQYEELEEAGKLKMVSEQTIRLRESETVFVTELEGQAVSFFEIIW